MRAAAAITSALRRAASLVSCMVGSVAQRRPGARTTALFARAQVSAAREQPLLPAGIQVLVCLAEEPQRPRPQLARGQADHLPRPPRRGGVLGNYQVRQLDRLPGAAVYPGPLSLLQHGGNLDRLDGAALLVVRAQRGIRPELRRPPARWRGALLRDALWRGLALPLGLLVVTAWAQERGAGTLVLRDLPQHRLDLGAEARTQAVPVGPLGRPQ